MPACGAPRQLAWYAIDVERPAIDVPGLRENLYKLRVTRRILFDRDSRPYFGDLAEVAERGEEVPVLGPPDFRQLLRELFVVGTVSIGPNVVNDGSGHDVGGDHGRGVRLVVRSTVRPSSASSSRPGPIRSPRATSSTRRSTAAPR